MSVTTKDISSSQNLGTDGKQEKPVAVLIAGPTASGKTALSIDLAKELNGLIVNADSMQIYRDLEILSARPSREEVAEAPHHLFGYVPLDEPYSVMRWHEDFKKVFNAARAENRPVIVVGGTGLYFKALTEGFSLMPDIPEDIRGKWRALGEASDGAALHGILQERDSVMAERLRPSDRQRVVRALEVLEGTGKSLSYWQQSRSEPLVPTGRAICVVLDPDRAALHERIHRRFDMMVEQGAIGEATTIAEMQLDPGLTSLRAIGLSQLAAASEGELSLEEAIEKAKTETRRYAKRQTTFFRGQLSGWERLDPLDEDAVRAFRNRTVSAFS
ncbi:tRNA (adenosine(37)-N6)-dimethylallyltransferase MiaA [Pseudovibrio sp. SPO723]|uniref:tRNA (adenosine(37)-N6)-dimethylallyltransferase MiaA n=1 Tax=Nesiotobacter zosterae TaxID=392721 RepID=UPI0029C42AEF|nr:tRNA (adenosine(37)-N6)-dimethylallyltransferase MiaA [Pseudovibrio sp. SPO723]MDX5594070.1 tRNA (adenosine(37)-N6)-dimethylallyltransferase MiaA [Pseudovibrio sp. SPO723]